MKKYNYYTARLLTKITGFVFFSQLIMEVSGLITRKDDFEYTVHVCFLLFVLSGIYSLVLMLLNARNSVTQK